MSKKIERVGVLGAGVMGAAGIFEREVFSRFTRLSRHVRNRTANGVI